MPHVLRRLVRLHASVPRACIALLLAICFSVTPALAASPKQPLRVMTFNVRLPVDSDGPNRWEARRDLMARTIREHDPDVIGTQELFKRQGDDIVARLPQYAWFGDGRRGGDGDEHMGIFYRTDRLRVVESGNFWLSDTPEVVGSITWGNLYPRMVTWARFERISDGAHFTLYDTHFPYRDEDEPTRTRSARLILTRLAALPADEPIVLAGDFNTTPDSSAHGIFAALLTDAWIAAPTRSGPDATFHDFTGKPDKRIDWILTRGLRAQSVETITTHEDAHYPSDHFAVFAVFGWIDGEAPPRASGRARGAPRHRR